MRTVSGTRWVPATDRCQPDLDGIDPRIQRSEGFLSQSVQQVNQHRTRGKIDALNNLGDCRQQDFRADFRPDYVHVVAAGGYNLAERIPRFSPSSVITERPMSW